MESKPIERDDERLKFVDLATAQEPPEGLIEHIKDRYWAYCPEKGIIFYRPHRSHSGAPQCNSSRKIAETLVSRLYPWAQVKFVPSVFRRIDPHDY